MITRENHSISPASLVILLLAFLVGAALLPAAASAGTVTEAIFSADPVSGPAPLTVEFTDASTFKFEPGTWAWDFEDDGTVDSTDQNPIHTYTDPGTYTVNLTVTDDKGNIDSEIKTDYITVTVPPPVADFTADKTWGTVPITVQFTDQSTNSPTSWKWEYTTGTIWTEFSTDQNPSFGFTTANKYDIRLTATNAAGSDDETKIDYIKTTHPLQIVKYAADGTTILAQTTITIEEMESTLPVYGDGDTHYYFQGPTFDDSSFDALWNPDEDVNVESRDYGAVKGTDVRDLCDLVGGMDVNDYVKIKAVDNFNKDFDYDDVYTPDPDTMRMVVAWYNGDDSITGEGQGEGYPPDFYSGMRLFFFADTTVNPWGYHAFGDWNMHESLSPNRWHYYYGSPDFWPSSSGLSVKFVNRILIYQPNLISCDASGNPVDSFAPGETVYVKGLDLASSTSYKLWIQDEPVLLKPLDSLHQQAGTYTLSTGNDPSGAQETVTTDSNGDFGPVAIWTIGSSESEAEYDIIADNQASGTVGTYDTYDVLDHPGRMGFDVVSAPTISIEAPYDKTGWAFSTGENVDTDTVKVIVTTTASAWHVSASDALNDGKPAATEGKLAEYTGSAYVSGGEALTNALQVNCEGGTYITLSGTVQEIYDGTTSGTYDVGLKQVIEAGDLMLTSPNTYRIVVTFTGATD